MRAFVSILAIATPLLVFGAPVKRQAGNSTDVLVLQFADVLENFENQFYTQALGQFQQADFVAAGFSNVQIPIQQFEAIQSDEAAHVTALESALQALGASPISGCQFNFSSALTNVSTMAATARVVENLGVAAYLGAANMISDPTLLTAAASIMTVEARHQTILNLMNGATALPQAFDIAFTPSEVLAIASQFISGCEIGIPANPTLVVTNTSPPLPGTTLSFSSSALNGSTDGLFCQMLVGGLPVSVSQNFSSCVVPDTVNGPAAVFITSDDQPIDSNVRDQNTNTVVAGPAMIFINANVDALGELVLSGAAAANATTKNATTNATLSAGSSTRTISPSQASAIVSSALAQGASVSAVAGAVPSSMNSAPVVAMPGVSGASSNATSSADSSTRTISPSQASAIVSSALAHGAPVSATAGAVPSSLNSAPAAATPGVSSASAAATPGVNSNSAGATSDVSSGPASALSVPSASASSSAAPAVATDSTAISGGTDVVAFLGGPNLYTGPAADGSVTVNGWS
ncbi:ferritin-like domain-containing protein [Sparassis latifolia]